MASRDWWLLNAINPEATDMEHASDTPTLLLGLDGFVLLHAIPDEHELVVLVETSADRAFCCDWGVQAVSKGRARTLVRDVPIGDRPVVLIWKKRIWRCQWPARRVRGGRRARRSAPEPYSERPGAATRLWARTARRSRSLPMTWGWGGTRSTARYSSTASRCSPTTTVSRVFGLSGSMSTTSCVAASARPRLG